jgi:hypothetical protein
MAATFKTSRCKLYSDTVVSTTLQVAERLRMTVLATTNQQDIEGLDEKDVASLADVFSARTQANGKIIFGVGRLEPDDSFTVDGSLGARVLSNQP